MDKQYNTIEQLEYDFIRGLIPELPESITINGVVYESIQHRAEIVWSQMLANKDKKALAVYTSSDSAIAFGWSVTEQLHIVPAGCVRVSLAESVVESTDIHYSEQVSIDGLNGDQPFDAKIDTGADVCSLHAENIDIRGDVVSFTINGKTYTMNLHRTQTIKQADSQAAPRPVVLLNFTIAGHTVGNVECNLNDRSGMSSPLLIGKNLLSKHDFVIHTAESDNTSPTDIWSSVDRLFETHQVEHPQEPSEPLTLSKAIEFLLHNNVSLQDITQHTQTK